MKTNCNPNMNDISERMPYLQAVNVFIVQDAIFILCCVLEGASIGNLDSRQHCKEEAVLIKTISSVICAQPSISVSMTENPAVPVYDHAHNLPSIPGKPYLCNSVIKIKM